jgi:hypothetical protein
VHLGVWWRYLNDGVHLKDICRDGRIELECFWKIQDGSSVAKDMDQQYASVNIVVNCQVL